MSFDPKAKLDQGKYELALSQERNKRGVPLNLAGPINFDPQKHPRDLKGQFRTVVGKLKPGQTVDMPDGTRVTREGGSFNVSRKGVSGGANIKSADAAADEAITHSAKARDPKSVGGAGSFNNADEAVKAQQASTTEDEFATEIEDLIKTGTDGELKARKTALEQEDSPVATLAAEKLDDEITRRESEGTEADAKADATGEDELESEIDAVEEGEEFGTYFTTSNGIEGLYRGKNEYSDEYIYDFWRKKEPGKEFAETGQVRSKDKKEAVAQAAAMAREFAAEDPEQTARDKESAAKKALEASGDRATHHAGDIDSFFDERLSYADYEDDEATEYGEGVEEKFVGIGLDTGAFMAELQGTDWGVTDVDSGEKGIKVTFEDGTTHEWDPSPEVDTGPEPTDEEVADADARERVIQLMDAATGIEREEARDGIILDDGWTVDFDGERYKLKDENGDVVEDSDEPTDIAERFVDLKKSAEAMAAENGDRATAESAIRHLNKDIDAAGGPDPDALDDDEFEIASNSVERAEAQPGVAATSYDVPGVILEDGDVVAYQPGKGFVKLEDNEKDDYLDEVIAVADDMLEDLKDDEDAARAQYQNLRDAAHKLRSKSNNPDADDS